MGALLVAGTTSDAGKSVLAAGICRWLARRGVRVAPFKAQNMSNNSAVTVEGGEIGRAQALQAAACGLAPSVRFNPVLLKPGGDRSSQVVVLGKVRGNINASDRVDIRSEGSLTGDVIAQRISIEDGAFFKGGIDIRKPGSPDSKSSEAAKPVSV